MAPKARENVLSEKSILLAFFGLFWYEWVPHYSTEHIGFRWKHVKSGGYCITVSRVTVILLNGWICLLVELQRWRVCDQRGQPV